MIGLSLSVSPGSGAGPTGEALETVTALFFGQSEIGFIMETDAEFREIAQPTPGDGNLILFTQVGEAAPVRTEVNSTTVAAGLVNPAMAALSAFLDFARPGQQFVIGDGGVGATGRVDLMDDENTLRDWSDLTDVVDDLEAEFGQVGHVIECWYYNDHTFTDEFRDNFWPMYFGVDGAGDTFTLGTEHTPISTDVDHCLWDADAAGDATGRGIFTRDGTQWHILTPMPFSEGPDDAQPEDAAFDVSQRNGEPLRAVLHGLADDSIAQSVSLSVGPSAHLSDFGGDLHPILDDADGQVLFVWPYAIALLRAAGMTIDEPTITGVSGPESGEYADIEVSLPNGGTLTTLRLLREEDMPASPSPHQQEVTGFEITRVGAARRPVYLEAETTYPEAHRGVVEILDSGSGSPRTGTVRITPETAFEGHDAISYLKGQATAYLDEDVDVPNQLHRDMLMEHIPALYDDTALYPFEGIAVRPYQGTLLSPVPAAVSMVDFEGTAPYRTTGFGNTATEIEGGWRWTITELNTQMAFVWLTLGRTHALPTTLSFDIVSDVDCAGVLEARAGANNVLTAVRGLQRPITLAAGVPQSISAEAFPLADSDFIGFRLVANLSEATALDITNMTLTYTD